MNVTDTYGQHPGYESTATFSDDRVYRYALTRRWGDGTLALFVMLNPSSADARFNDATITRCARFARREGHGGLAVVNLFALRTRDPRKIRAHPEPVGPDNDWYISMHARKSAVVIVAWGTMGGLNGRATAVTGMLRAAGVELRCFGTTAYGHPRHPLYLPAVAPLHEYR